MLAFAANSVLCRLALAGQQIDSMSFSLIRVCSGVVVLLVLYLFSAQKTKIEWSVKNGFFLALYIVAFSLAYLHLDAGVGALLLFGTVQLSMVGYGLCHGEKINMRRGAGLCIAIIGILILLLPGAAAPNLVYAAIMVLSGIGWAMYSIAGKKMQNPVGKYLGQFCYGDSFCTAGLCCVLHKKFCIASRYAFGGAVRRFGLKRCLCAVVCHCETD